MAAILCTADGAGLANLAASTGTFGYISVSSTFICMYVWLTVRLNGTLMLATSR